MKRFLSFFVIMMLLAGLFSFAQAEDITFTGTVTGGSLHLRQEADSSSKSLGTYKSGAKVTVLENLGAWCKVQAGSKTGYMMTQYLEITANYPHLGWGRTADDGTVLNVRAGAGFTFPVIAKVMSGAAFELIEDAGTWYRVRLGTQFGYIEKEKISPVEGEFEQGFSLTDKKEAYTAAIMYSALREFGSPKTQTRNEGEFTYSFTYPDTGLAAADSKMSAWVQSTLRTFEADHEQYHAGTPASYTVEYQSLSIDDRYKSILLFGEYKVNNLTADTLLALNLDLETGTLLDNEALLPKNEARVTLCLEGAASSLMPKATDGYTGKADTSWLRYAVLGRDGVQVWFPAGQFIPAALGSRKLTLRYSQVAECMELYSETIRSRMRTIDPSQPMVALTFDDGPSEETDRILKVLLEYDARATFCVIGNKLETYPDVLKRTVAGGNEIACHTWSHPYLNKISAASARSQIERTVNAVKEISGYEVKVLRPPYGKHNLAVRNICKDMGIVIARWEVDTLDWKTRSANKTYNAIMKGATTGMIILCHDLYDTTAAAVERAVPELVAKGIQLVTVSELLSFHKDGAQPGKVYNRVNPENIVTGK
ncbi:MAG: polysaccharide deacetylase family protein [Clostridia bacterium]|nr:polysaccharide deacetylase family protein [Clostridia bacterium]